MARYAKLPGIFSKRISRKSSRYSRRVPRMRRTRGRMYRRR